jgi:hypothetical protein
MYRVIATTKGTAPLSQSRQHFSEKLDGESEHEYDKRTWREKLNYDDKGICFLPAMALKKAMDTAASRLSIPDPDNRRAKLTKYFVSDVIPEGNMSLGIHKDKVQCVVIGADRGEGKRVPSHLPQMAEWGGICSFLVMEEKIKPAMFEKVFRTAGRSIGVGQFRPENGGLNGRFDVIKIKVESIAG